MKETLINGRWTLLLPEHRAEREQWKIENGGWEKERLAAMAECIARQGKDAARDGLDSPVVYDIGAEEGDFPALWASWGADVLLVEPNPLVWPNIRAIFEANDLVDHVVECWVGFAGDFLRPAEEQWLHDWLDGGRDIWPQCAFGPVIGDHGFLVLPERPDVPVMTIDYAAHWTRRPPTVITIDVEGAELTVLRGARATLEESKPAVFVSVHIDLPWIDEKYPGDTGDKVGEFMEGFGYVGRHLATDHEEHWEWRHPEGR